MLKERDFYRFKALQFINLLNKLEGAYVFCSFLEGGNAIALYISYQISFKY